MKNEEYIWLAEFLNGKQIVAIGNDKAGALRGLYDRVRHDFKGRLASMDFNEFITLSTVKVTPMISIEGLVNNEKESKQMNREEALKNRIDIITGKAERDRVERIRKELEYEERIDNLIKQVCGMKDRIKDIINLANVCMKNKVFIPITDPMASSYKEAGKKYGYPHEFIAEGWAHHVGLILKGSSITKYQQVKLGLCEFKYVGIINGGACGCYDLYTDGDEVFFINEDDPHDIRRPSEKDLKQFLDEFTKFEKGFLNWIDSLRA